MGDHYSTAKVDFGLLTPKCLLFMNENKASGISHCNLCALWLRAVLLLLLLLLASLAGSGPAWRCGCAAVSGRVCWAFCTNNPKNHHI